jgi:hypothetical protein
MMLLAIPASTPGPAAAGGGALRAVCSSGEAAMPATAASRISSGVRYVVLPFASVLTVEVRLATRESNEEWKRKDSDSRMPSSSLLIVVPSSFSSQW